MQSVVDLRRRNDRDGEGTSKKKGKSPLKLFSSSFSALARFEVGREPARALRLRDSMRSVCQSGHWCQLLLRLHQGWRSLRMTDVSAVGGCGGCAR